MSTPLKGQGDKFEGAIAFCNEWDIENLNCLNEKYINKLNFSRCRDGCRVYLKDDGCMGLPCHCMFILKNDFIGGSPTIEYGCEVYTGIIPSKLFEDFAGGITTSKFNKMQDGDKPAIIVINDFEEFKTRLKNKLAAMGIAENEIIITPIYYVDYQLSNPVYWLDLGQKVHHHLAIKSKEFEYQSELRIIINTNNEDTKKVLLEKPTCLGSMHDIAGVITAYPYDGIIIKMRAPLSEELKTNSNL